MKRVYPLAVLAIVIAVVLSASVYFNNKNDKNTSDVKGVTTTQQEASVTADDESDTATQTEVTTPQTDTQVTPVATTSTAKKAPVATVTAVLATNPVSAPVNPIVTPVTPPIVTPLVAPQVAIASPVANAVLGGAQTVTVSASDDRMVTQVSLSVDGVTVSTVLTAPYTFSWNTIQVTNGTHTLVAYATDNDNQTTASAAVSVTVNNVVVPPVVANNLVANPSVEDNTANTPTAWSADGYGTNDRVFSYENTGHTGGHSLKTTITTATGEGDAKWFFSPIAVTAGGTYKYSNWYKSDVDTAINVMVNMSDNTTQYFYMMTAPKSADWTQVTGTFKMPANAVMATVFQVLPGVGSVQTDDFSMTSYMPTPFSRGLVSLTFDDGWRSIYTNALPLLQKYSLVSTQYLLTSTTDFPDYMTTAMMQAFKDAGSEIAAHTVNHCDLTGVQTEDPAVCPTPISSTQVQSELVDSKAGLQTMTGATVTDFATPYGAYNADVIAAIKAAGYDSHRSTDVGFNSADNFDPYNIKVQNMTNTTTIAQVQAWIDEAIANKTWLVIVYHEVSTTVTDPTYAVTPTDLDAQLAYIKQSGIAVATVHDALAELTPQAAVVTTP